MVNKTHLRAFVMLAFLNMWGLSAQTDTTQQQGTDEKDIGDVYFQLFSKHGIKKEDSVKISQHKVYTSVLPGFGYSILTGFTAVVTSNFSFYVNKKRKDANISSIFLSPEYGVNKQLTVIYQANIFTNKNKWNIVSDWRYYHYSVFIFPMVVEKTAPVKDLVYFSLFKFHQMFYRQVAPDLFAGIGYKFDEHYRIRTSGNTANPTHEEYKKYGDGSMTLSSGLTGSILYDKRRNSNNPVGGGSYFNVEYRNNSRRLGSSYNWQSWYYDIRKYFKVPGRSKSILAFWNFGTLTTKGKVPYFDLPSTMWDVYDNSGRPYIQGRFRGRNMLYFETEYRFNLMKNGLLGGATFANLEAFSNNTSNSYHRMIPGTGASLRIKANKKSEVNFIISYGVGIHHSHGFFFNVGDVF